MLQDRSVAVPNGESFALMGASVSGKTALLNLITGLDAPSAGEVRVGSHLISSMPETKLACWRTVITTALAFTPVVALLTIMLAFVKGMHQLTERSDQPGNVIGLTDRATVESLSNPNFTDTSVVERRPEIIKGENDRPLVSKEVYVIVDQQILVPKAGKPRR